VRLPVRMMSRRGLLETAVGLVAGTWAGALIRPEVRPARADERDVVRVGVLVPVTGVYAQLGSDILAGMKLYLEKVGYTVAGRRILLSVADEGATNAVALDGARRLLQQERVHILTGVVSSAAVLAIRPLVEASRTPLVVSLAGAQELAGSQKSRWIYRVSYSTPTLDIPLGPYVYTHIARKVVLSAANYIGGTQHLEAFKTSFLAAGGSILAEIRPPLGTTDYGPYLVQIAGARPQATFNFYAGADAIHFVQQYAQFGLAKDVPMLGNGFLTDESILPAEGMAALGVQTSLPWSIALEIPANRRFALAYFARYARNPNISAVFGYDTAQVVVAALQAVEGRVDNPIALADAIGRVKIPSPRGDLGFDSRTHDLKQTLFLRRVTDVVPPWLKPTQVSLVNSIVADLGSIG
jgi:branched-chain amino acid transport system substrate-binding protein